LRWATWATKLGHMLSHVGPMIDFLLKSWAK
jgi:hypothetical protein